MSRKRLDKKSKELFEQFSNEVSHIENFYRDYSCFPDRPWDSNPKKRIGRKKASLNDLPEAGIEFAYAQIADELPSDGLLVDFIEGVKPFVANNARHATALLLGPQDRNSTGDFLFTKGYGKLLEQARVESNERSRSKKNSGLSCSQTAEAFLVKDFFDQMKRYSNDGRIPEPLRLNTLVHELMGGHWNQGQVSKALQNSRFKNYKGYVGWFRQKTGRNPPPIPRDRNGRVIRDERVDESFQSLDEYEAEGDNDIDQQWD